MDQMETKPKIYEKKIVQISFKKTFSFAIHSKESFIKKSQTREYFYFFKIIIDYINNYCG